MGIWPPAPTDRTKCVVVIFLVSVPFRVTNVQVLLSSCHRPDTKVVETQTFCKVGQSSTSHYVGNAESYDPIVLGPIQITLGQVIFGEVLRIASWKSPVKRKMGCLISMPDHLKRGINLQDSLVVCTSQLLVSHSVSMIVQQSRLTFGGVVSLLPTVSYCVILFQQYIINAL